MDKQLASHVAEQAGWSVRQTILLSAAGFGGTLICTLLVLLPELGEFNRKLVAQGKHKNVALTVCMRKLITILDAMVINKTELVIYLSVMGLDATFAYQTAYQISFPLYACYCHIGFKFQYR